MLKFLRKGATSLYAKIFLAIIVIVFVFWGIGSFTSERRNLLAKVNGIPITLKEFQEYYTFQVARLKQTFGEISPEDLAKIKLKDQVLEELIKIKLLEDTAKNLKIKITRVEISYAISQIPAFQENGQFNPIKYQHVLKELGISPDFFEKLIKTDLIYQRLKLLLTAPIFISEDEVKEYLEYNKQMLEILEASLPLKLCTQKITPSEKDLENYYLSHRDIYKEKEKVKIAYLFIPYQGIVHITEEEVKKYYEENMERFKKPLKVKLKRILIPISEPNAFEKAQAVRAELKSLSDFSKYGAAEGEWFEEASLPEPLKNLIKASHPKEIIGPIKLSSGFLILGIEEIQPERILTLNEIKPEIYKFLEKEKITKEAREKVNKIYTEVVKANGLSAWAKEKNVLLNESDWLAREELSKKLNNLKLAQKIINSPKGEFFTPVETSEGLLIIEVKDKKPERTLSFTEAKERVKKDFLFEKGKELCEKEAYQLIENLKNKKEIRKSDPYFKEFVVKDIKISRNEINKNLSPLISQELMMTGKKGVIEKPFWDQEILKIFYIQNIIPFEGKIEEKEISEISQDSLREKRDTYFKVWYQLLRKKAKVKIYPIFEKL